MKKSRPTRIRHGIELLAIVSVGRFLLKRSLQQKPSTAPKIGSQASPKVSKLSRFWEILTERIIPFATIISVLLILWQANLLSNQVEIDKNAQNSATRSADMRFLSAIRVDITRDEISVTNRSELTAPMSALWILEKHTKGSMVNELLGTIQGVPACSALTANREDLAKSTSTTGKDAHAYHIPDSAEYEVNYVTQAPSGQWYLVANSGRIEEIEFSNGRRDEKDEWYARGRDRPMSALKHSNLYQTSADTYWGGYESVQVYNLPEMSGGDIVTGGPFKAKIDLLEC